MVGRAGIGVDNVDIPAATARGVVVMNTPFGNSITTAEHAIALMFALARQLPEADASTQQGKWEKNRFMGVEVTGKTLGLIGCGNIGSIVATRALGLKMKVAAFDPFLTPERAVELGVDKVELDEMLRRADFITLHTPLTDQTRNILSRENLAKTKKGVRIINCARGGLIDEQALKEALDSGQVAGAALDVFEKEPATASPLFGTPGFISTPHLGASTSEAQVNVAIQVAEQMSDYLLLGGVTNAVNMPSLTAEEAPRLKPYMALAEKLGKLAGQILGEDVRSVSVEVEGAAAQLNPKPITGAVLAGLMSSYSDSVNMVNAPFLAKQRGLDVREVRHDREGAYHTLIAVEAMTPKGLRRVAGTLLGKSEARLVELFGIEIDAELEGQCSTSSIPTRRGLSASWERRSGIRHQHCHLQPRPPRGGEAVRWSRSTTARRRDCSRGVKSFRMLACEEAPLERSASDGVRKVVLTELCRRVRIASAACSPTLRIYIGGVSASPGRPRRVEHLLRIIAYWRHSPRGVGDPIDRALLGRATEPSVAACGFHYSYADG